MPAILSEHEQWFDSVTGEPIVNGYVYIGIRSLDPVANPQNIYSDRALTTALANPQRTDADGRTVNKIWVADRYSIKVTDSAGSQKYLSLDNGHNADAVGITADDTDPGYLSDKITVSGIITKTIVDPGGNETLNLETLIPNASVIPFTPAGTALSTTVAVKLDGVDNIAALLSAVKAGSINVFGYHTKGDTKPKIAYWDATQDKSNHNGGTIIDPDVTFPTDWTNQTQVAAWFTAGTGLGCWVMQSNDFNVKDFGTVNNGTTDDTIAFDALLTYCWANYTNRFNVGITDGLTLLKAGDFNIPPNIQFCGDNNKSRVYIGNQLTRLYHKRDNTAVAAEYQTDGGYWSLGHNRWTNIQILPTSAVVSVDEVMFVSDLIQFETDGLVISDDKFTVGLHLQNDTKWCEYWYFHGSSEFIAATAGIKFSRASGSAYASFGHGSCDAIVSAIYDGQAGILITDGASPYNSKWKIRGFCRAPTALNEAYVFKLDSGGVLNYAEFNISTENLGNNGTAYGIHVDTTLDATWGTSSVSFCGGIFRGIGSATKFKNVSAVNDIKVTGGDMLDAAGSSVYQGNQIPKVVTGASDTNSDNLMRGYDEKAIQVYMPGTLAANDVVAYLPINFNRFRVCSISIRCGTASSGNTGAVWNFGIRKSGSTNPSDVMTIADGSLSAYDDVMYDLPSSWYENDGNHIVCRSLDGSGNDGVGPSEVWITIKYADV